MMSRKQQKHCISLPWRWRLKKMTSGMHSPKNVMPKERSFCLIRKRGHEFYASVPYTCRPGRYSSASQKRAEANSKSHRGKTHDASGSFRQTAAAFIERIPTIESRRVPNHLSHRRTGSEDFPHRTSVCRL